MAKKTIKSLPFIIKVCGSPSLAYSISSEKEITAKRPVLV